MPENIRIFTSLMHNHVSHATYVILTRSSPNRISKRGSVLKVRGSCYNKQLHIHALQVTECGYKTVVENLSWQKL